MNDQNPYAAPQTIDTREVLPFLPPTNEQRDYRWLQRGLCSLALVLSPLTILILWRFREFAALGISVMLPFCSGMLAAVPPRTPGRICLALAAIMQAVGCFCIFALVLTMRDGDKSAIVFGSLAIIAGAAEVMFYLSLMLALIRLGYWLQDRWLCQLSYASLGFCGLYFLSVWLVRHSDLHLIFVIGYLMSWIALLLGLRIPRLIAARVADPPRFDPNPTR